MKTFIIISIFCAGLALSANVNIRNRSLIKKLNLKNPKVVGGGEVIPHSLPYQAAIFWETFICAGSLISTKHVLTSGSCVDTGKYPEVILGAHQLSADEDVVIMSAKKVTYHPGFNQMTLHNDVAIIELPQEVTLNENIQTVELAPPDSGTFEKETAVVAGWGILYDGSTTTSDVLIGANVTVISNEWCAFNMGDFIDETNICTEGANKTEPCSGDQGAPLVLTTASSKIQIGIFSGNVYEGCETGAPPAYERVSHYYDWIQKIIKQ